MTLRLDHPADEASLYVARGDDVPLARPLLQGDVFALEDRAAAMVLTHACSMRRGAELRDRVVIGEVVQTQRVPPRAWPTGFFDLFPLPQVHLSAIGEHVAVDFTALATIPTTSLALSRRVACLSDEGVALLQQRHAHHLTRVKIDLATLHEHSAPVLAEAELQQDWVEAHMTASGANLVQPDWEQIGKAEHEFQEFLGEGQGSLRAMLIQPERRGHVRRSVRSEIRRRFG